RSNTFKNFLIGTGVQYGFVCEWADPSYAGTNPVAGQSVSACHFNTFQDGTDEAYYEGFDLEDAEGTTIKDIKFIGNSRAAIKDYMSNSGDNGQTTTWQNQGNDFSGLPAGSQQYITAH